VKIAFTAQGWADYLHWQDADPALAARLNLLIKDASRSPFAGLGKPEPLSPSQAPDQEYFFVKSGKVLNKILLEDILYFESEKEYVKLVTGQTQLLLYRRLKDIEEQLPPPFVRVHNSYIINTKLLIKIEDNHIYIADKRIPVIGDEGSAIGMGVSPMYFPQMTMGDGLFVGALGASADLNGGSGKGAKLAIAWLVAFFPIVVDTATGLRNTPAEFLDLATAVRASRFQTFWKIRFPAALPFVISGSKVAITLAVIGAVIGEFMGSNEGLGNLLLVANSQINIPLAFACLIGLAAIGIGLYGAVAAVELALKPWFGETVNG